MNVVRMAPETAQRAVLNRVRLHRRFLAELPVRCLIQENEETFREVVGHTGNVGLCGILTWLPETLAPGTLFRIHLGLPQGTVIAEGKVIWQDDDKVGNRPIPHGVQLLRFVEDAGGVQYRRFLGQTAASNCP